MRGLPREDMSPFIEEEPLQQVSRVRSLARCQADLLGPLHVLAEPLPTGLRTPAARGRGRGGLRFRLSS